MSNLWLILSIVTVLFVLWSEYSVGNILFRNDSFGSKSLNWPSLVGFMSHPFRSTMLWTRETLDINYAFVIVTTIIMYYVVKT